MRKVYYNITITGLSVAVAMLIGTIEIFGLLAAQLNLSGGFWDFMSELQHQRGRVHHRRPVRHHLGRRARHLALRTHRTALGTRRSAQRVRLTRARYSVVIARSMSTREARIVGKMAASDAEDSRGDRVDDQVAARALRPR